jgi:hypothetical protein
MKLAFVMTINKSQGQSVTHVGIDLHLPIFIHELLYVALSVPHNNILLLPESSTQFKTTNVVYHKIFLPS